jgi:hypothetical protein
VDKACTRSVGTPIADPALSSTQSFSPLMTSPLHRLQAENVIVALNATTHLCLPFNGERK